MHRCRHEQDEDHYASGAENRRRNRDRLNREIAVYDDLRRVLRGGYSPPFSGQLGMPGIPYGFGSGGHPSLSTLGISPRHAGFPGMWGPDFYSSPYDGDSYSDDESPSPWYPPPSPWYGTSPLCTSRRLPRPLFGRRNGRGLPNPYNDAFDDDYYRRLPRSFFSHRGMRY